MVDHDLIKTWLSEAAERIRRMTEEVTRLQTEIAAERREEAALRALLNRDADQAVESSDGGDRPALPSSPATNSGTVSIHPVERGAVEILEQRGKPIHISEIRTELVKRGVPIPGKGTDANVIIYLTGSATVCRVGRGLYALRAWGVPEVPARHRRSGRKKRSKRS